MRAAAAAFMCFIVLLLIAGIGGIMWTDLEKEREVRHLRAQADVFAAEAEASHAEAERLDAEADWERAQGERSLKESEGRAIEAPALAAARAVDSNTRIVGAMGKTNTLYDRLLPLGGLLFMVVLVLAGAALGVGGLAVYLFLRERKKNEGLKLVAPVTDTALDLK